MDDIFIYFVPLPNTVHEMVTPCIEGYTIYLNLNDDLDTQKKGYEHALNHINNRDFDGGNVQEIEIDSHKEVI